MLMMPSSIKVWVASQPIDMRKGFNTLAAMIQAELKLDPRNGQLFVFFGKNTAKIKILFWDRNGFVLYYKSLAQGRFRPPRVEQTRYQLSVSDLTLILEGIDLTLNQRLSAV